MLKKEGDRSWRTLYVMWRLFNFTQKCLEKKLKLSASEVTEPNEIYRSFWMQYGKRIMSEQDYRENDKETWFIWYKNNDELRVELGMERGRGRDEIGKYTKMELAELDDWMWREGERDQRWPWVFSYNGCESTWAIPWHRGYHRKSVFGLQDNELNFGYIEFSLFVTCNWSCLEANWI